MRYVVVSIYESRDGNSLNIFRKLHGVAGRVISATGARQDPGQADQHQPSAQPGGNLHWIFPSGRVGIMLSAHSTAVIAAMRRLSAAAHSQIPFGRAASLLSETRMLA